METSLFAATPHFGRFFHDNPVGMVIVTVDDGRYAEVNRAFAHLLGYEREELIGRPFEVMGLSDSDVRRMVMNVLMNSRKLSDVPLLLETRGDRTLTCIASAQLEQINGNPYFFLIIQDLTRHERSLEELRASETRSRLFFHSIPLPLLVYDEESGRILDVNPAACEQYGYSPEEFTALTWSDLLPPGAAADETQADATGDPISRHRLKDGRVIEVEISRDHVLLDGRRIQLATVRDVTEQRLNEAELRASRERLRIMADVTTDAIWIRDLATDEVEWSAGLKVQFGYEDDEAPGHHWWLAHVHPDDRAAVAESVAAALHSAADNWMGEYRFLRADGTYASVLDRGRIIRDESGRPIRFLGAMVDITEQLQVAEAAGRAALEERQRLARDLHESVSQSLYSLSLMSEAARRRWVDSDEPVSTEYISRLGDLSRQALRQLRLLVYELRPAQLEQVGLAAALRHRLEAVEQRAGIAFRLQNDLVIAVSPEQKAELFRLAQDMLNHSLKYAGATAVSVRLWHEGSRLLLEISDNGWGPDASPPDHDLRAIHNHLDALGGELEVTGTTLRACLPLA